MKLSDLEKMVLPIGVMNIDVTHIHLLHAILSVGKFKHALEIGSFDGASAVAFIAAMNDGSLAKMDFCDPYFQPRFFDIIEHCHRAEDIGLHRCISTDDCASSSATD